MRSGCCTLTIGTGVSGQALVKQGRATLRHDLHPKKVIVWCIHVKVES